MIHFACRRCWHEREHMQDMHECRSQLCLARVRPHVDVHRLRQTPCRMPHTPPIHFMCGTRLSCVTKYCASCHYVGQTYCIITVLSQKKKQKKLCKFSATFPYILWFTTANSTATVKLFWRVAPTKLLKKQMFRSAFPQIRQVPRKSITPRLGSFPWQTNKFRSVLSRCYNCILSSIPHCLCSW